MDAELLNFIRASINSTWALELLLLMRRQRPRAFQPEELVLALRGTNTLVNTCLDQLLKSGLVARNEAGEWLYAPASPALEELVAQLESAYAEKPVSVINAIVASPNDRLKSFADAFKLPKKDD